MPPQPRSDRSVRPLLSCRNSRAIEYLFCPRLRKRWAYGVARYAVCDSERPGYLAGISRQRPNRVHTRECDGKRTAAPRTVDVSCGSPAARCELPLPPDPWLEGAAAISTMWREGSDVKNLQLPCSLHLKDCAKDCALGGVSFAPGSDAAEEAESAYSIISPPGRAFPGTMWQHGQRGSRSISIGSISTAIEHNIERVYRNVQNRACCPIIQSFDVTRRERVPLGS